MKTMAKLLFYLVPITVIVFLSLMMADMYFRRPFYIWYLLISVVVMLGLWVASMLVLKVTYAHPLPKGFYLRLVAAWTATAVLGWAINHLVLAGFLASAGQSPSWSVFTLVFVWAAGLVLILAWQVSLSLLQRIFLSEQLRVLRTISLVIFGIVVVGVVAVLIVNAVIKSRYSPLITTLEDAPEAETAIVFGAGVYHNPERPSAVLRERLDTAADLLAAGKVQQILLSGDGSVGSIEVDVMSDYSVGLGISEDNLIADREGFRTLETCQRAAEDFGVQDALLVTQAFHLPRALYLCDSLGLEVHGVQADRRAYSPLSLITWTVRESVATAYAWFEVTTGL